MYEITSQIYEKTAQRFCDLVGRAGYFSGTIEFAHEDTECKMVATIIIYHKIVDMPEGRMEVIDDIVPVWWEFRTTVGGEELINDFDFSVLKEHITE